MQRTKKIILAALLAAFTCVATMIIRIPTPTLGYIHLGDGFVLLCGILLGPLYGAVAAGVGSMLSDFFAGYMTYVPATLVIKALTALIAGLIFAKCGKKIRHIVWGGILAELVMALGYFLFEGCLSIASGGAAGAAFLAAAAGIPMNLIQGGVGVLIAALLYPVLHKAMSQE